MINIDYLKNTLPDFDLFYYDSLDSTNNEAKRKILSGTKKKCIYIANHQTAGRGRMNRSFYSPKDTGIYLSFSYKSDASFGDAVNITSQAAVALAETLESVTDKTCGIKWVNDIYIDGKKIAGILAESVTTDSPYVILGIGLNITTESFPEELSSKAGSLNISDFPKTEFVKLLSEKILYFINHPKDSNYLKSYISHSVVLGRKIEYVKNSELIKGTALSVTNKGELKVLRTDGTTDILSSGEISLTVKN